MSRCRLLAVTAEPHPFQWADIEQEPKVWRSCLTRAHRTMQYEILHTGGFLRLCTERGRVYWLAQNTYDHRLPDWKLHFSVCKRDVPRAWDLLSRLFMDRACDFGMKAVAGEALETWPERQRGRELTVYIFQHCSAYAGGGPMMEHCPAGTEHRFWLGPEYESDATTWASFVQEAEELLSSQGIESNGGVADGDLPLGRYASIRNEAFVYGNPEFLYIYPPNEAGWNAAGHLCPLTLPWSAAWRARLAAASRAVRCASRRRGYGAPVC